MPKQVACHECAGPAAEPGTGPGAGTDVKEAANRRPVARLLRERPPDEILVECE